MKIELLNEPAIGRNKFCKPKLFIWPERVLYFGSLEYVPLHRYGATILLVGLSGPFLIRLKGTQWLAYRACIVPAGLSHEIHVPEGPLAKLFIELGSHDHFCFSEKFSYNQHIAKVDHHPLIQNLSAIYDHNIDLEEAAKKVDEVIGYDKRNGFAFDARIKTSLQTIQSDLTQNNSEVFLANQVDLSPSRFRHLFKEQLGISHRQFRTWKRLIGAVREIHKTDRLTSAALEVGFSDQSHFTNHYKKTFGVKPSEVFRNLNDFYVEKTPA